MGAPDSSGTIRFSHMHAARVRIEDCTITNQGVACYSSTSTQQSGEGSDRDGQSSGGDIEAVPDKPCFWKRKVPRSESCRIVLRGRSEFVARGIEIAGDALFEVPDGQCMEVRSFQRCELENYTFLSKLMLVNSWNFPYATTSPFHFRFRAGYNGVSKHRERTS